MTTVLSLQKRLLALGYDPGTIDGLVGPATLGAMEDALSRLAVLSGLPADTGATPPPVTEIMPAAWMPWAHMFRIVVHWSVGRSTASVVDCSHYHLLIEGTGRLVRGSRSIPDNVNTQDGVYAAHVAGLNAGSIGVSLCGMIGAKEKPFDAGQEPITRVQWEKLPRVLAALCRRYGIPVTPQTVLTHAEVQGTLGVRQAGKWDIAILPFDQSFNTAEKVGNAMRAATKALL